MRPPVRREVPRRLALAECDRASVRARSLEHAERQRIDVRDRQRAGVVRRGRELRRVLEAAEDVRLITAAASSAARRTSSGSVTPSRCGTSTTSRPKPTAYVFTTWRTCGLVASVTTTFERPVACFAMKQASAVTVVPS